uniref:FMRFamide-related peptide 13 n=1 Tax=Heterodera glycines TaxID=51029 RepID=A0A977SM93_HETGL|nr:FMRFamide-related peptide 13 precursor [Heterodera glycines]
MSVKYFLSNFFLFSLFLFGLASAFDSSEVRLIEENERLPSLLTLLRNLRSPVYFNQGEIEKRAPLQDPLIRFGKRDVPVLARETRNPMGMDSPLIRFGKRSPMDGAPLIRFGRSSLDSGPLIRFGKRSDYDGAPLIRFGKRVPLSPHIRFGKRENMEEGIFRMSRNQRPNPIVEQDTLLRFGRSTPATEVA